MHIRTHTHTFLVILIYWLYLANRIPQSGHSATITGTKANDPIGHPVNTMDYIYYRLSILSILHAGSNIRRQSITLSKTTSDTGYHLYTETRKIHAIIAIVIEKSN